MLAKLLLLREELWGLWWSITDSCVDSRWKRRVICIYPWRNSHSYPLHNRVIRPQNKSLGWWRSKNSAPAGNGTLLLQSKVTVLTTFLFVSFSSSYSLSYSDYLCVLFCVYSVFFHSLLCFFGFPVFIYLFLSPCSSVQHPGTWESVCLVHMSVPAGSWK